MLAGRLFMFIRVHMKDCQTQIIILECDLLHFMDSFQKFKCKITLFMTLTCIVPLINPRTFCSSLLFFTTACPICIAMQMSHIIYSVALLLVTKMLILL